MTGAEEFNAVLGWVLVVVTYHLVFNVSKTSCKLFSMTCHYKGNLLFCSKFLNISHMLGTMLGIGKAAIEVKYILPSWNYRSVRLMFQLQCYLPREAFPDRSV